MDTLTRQSTLILQAMTLKLLSLQGPHGSWDQAGLPRDQQKGNSRIRAKGGGTLGISVDNEELLHGVVKEWPSSV